MRPNDVCDCCLISKPLHFKTDRRFICKDCIDELNETTVSPAEIIFCNISYFEDQIWDKICNEVEILNSLRSPSPILHQPSIEQLLLDALEEAKQEEGFWQSIYRSTIFGKPGRLARAMQIATHRQDQIAKDNNSILLDHQEKQRQIDSAFAELQIQADSIGESAFIDMLAYFAKELKAGGRSTEALVLQAYNLGLITYERAGVRLADEEWKDISRQVWKEDKGHCNACPSDTNALEVHHIIWIKNGGANHKANLITLCLQCHDKQHSWLSNRRRLK